MSPLDLRPAEPAAVVCAVLAASLQNLTAAWQRLESMLGPVQYASAAYAFEFSAYYRAEMGADLVKQLACFAMRVDPAELSRLKRQTMALERELSDRADGRLRRRANIDPGLVTVESLVLASTKYSGQRVCIAPGLYAEVTLIFQQGRWMCLPWTYPDYRTAPVHDFLLRIRTDLLQARRARLRQP